MENFIEQDKQFAESSLCKICKNTFKDPIQLPCSENICESHLNNFIIIDQVNHKSYFDCCFCNQQHPIVQGFEFIANKSPNNNQLNVNFFELQNECKQLLKKLVDSEKPFKPIQKYELSEYFADLRSKVDLKREEMILDIQNASDDLLRREEMIFEIQNASDDLINEINEHERDYFKKLENIYSDFDLEELKDKEKNYEKELNKNKIGLKELVQINEKIKEDLFQLDEIRKNSNKLVSSKAKIKFETVSVNKNLFGQIITNALTGRLISGSSDNSIKIWDLESCECIKTIIDLHTDFVFCLELIDDDKIASGSNDTTIKIWDLKTFECLKTLNGHSRGVFCLKKINQKELMSGSGDSTIKIWDLNSGDCIKTLEGHVDPVNNLEIANDKKIIISCSFDKAIKIWNYENGECLRTLTGHSSEVFSLTLINNKIISGCGDKKIKIWNIDSGECLKTYNEGPITFVKSFKENQFVSGSSCGEIKLWDIETGICLKTIEAHDEYITVFEVCEDGKIFSCSLDQLIKIWNIESGQCLKTLTGHLDSVHSLIYIP